MQTKTEVYRVAMALARGSRIEREFLTPAELREVFHALVEAVGPEAAYAELALVDGREGIMRFPKLSDEFISVRSSERLRAADFGFLPDRGSEVWGQDPRGFAALLADDLRRRWWVAVGLAGLAAAAFAGGQAENFVATVGQLLVVASSLFFTVFVIFGIGQVVRPILAHSLYRSGTLQSGLDADRYCVRLAVSGFALSFFAVGWNVAGPSIARAISADWGYLLVEIPCLALLWLASVAVFLSMLATVGYLLDRSADLALKQSALQSFDAAAERRARGRPAPPAQEPVREVPTPRS